MKGIATFFGKEWSEHRWLLFNQCGFSLLCFALIYYKMDGAESWARGSFSLAFFCWPVFALVVANSLTFRMYTLENQERTSQFLAGLPISRWQILGGKIAFCWCALMIVCVVYFGCTAAISPQANLHTWQSIFYPLVRLSAFNWVVVTLIFLVSMLGKFRWYVFLAVIAPIVYCNFLGSNAKSLLKVIPAIRLVEEERALGDIGVLPWGLIRQTLAIGGVAVLAILLVDCLLQRLRLGDYLARLLNNTDRLVVLLVILGLPLLLVTLTISVAPSKFDLEYHLAFEVDHKARSGSTLVELSYYKQSPKDESEQKLDQVMIEQIAGILEEARQRLEPRWWPERWLVVKSPDVPTQPQKWGRSVSGDALVYVANWEHPGTLKEQPEVILARWQLAYLIDRMLISKRHRERHSWVTAGLARFLIPQDSIKPIQQKQDIEFLRDNALDGWPGITKKSKNIHVLTSTLLREIEKQLGEEEFNSWIREVVNLGLAKPAVNTLFDLNRGGVYWRGLLRDSPALLDKRGFDPDPVLEVLKSQIKDAK